MVVVYIYLAGRRVGSERLAAAKEIQNDSDQSSSIPPKYCKLLLHYRGQQDSS